MRCTLGFSPVLVAFLMLAFPILAAEPAADRLEFAIAIHGGIGIDPNKLTEDQTRQHHAALQRAVEIGKALLAQGATALDAVEETVRVLEDEPIFNAGKGSVFNSVGKHELDAAIMDGSSGKGGAVASVMTVKNPISLARLVMTETSHVLLVGDGAEQFADEMTSRSRIERVSNEYFDTESARREWLDAVERAKRKQAALEHRGTVGCVALDQQGNLAAATSTGGMTNKKWGRVGDTPILGAGTYANNATCAVSCTGTGEHFIRNSIAFHVSALMAYRELPLDEAVHYVIEKVLPHDIGGLIAVDRRGRISMLMNTAGMSRAMADSTGKLETRLAP